MPVTVSVTQPHSLGRVNARERIEPKIANLISNHPEWSLTGSWTDNLYTYQSTSGPPAGVKGTIRVRQESVDMTMELPDHLASYSEFVRQKMQTGLANTLA